MTRSVVAGNLGILQFDIDSNDSSSETVVTISESEPEPEFEQRCQRCSHRALDRSCASPYPATRSAGTDPWASTCYATTGTLTAVITDNTIVRDQASA